MFEFAGIGLLGAMDTVGGVETWTEDLLLALAVATPHGLDDVIKAGFLLLILLIRHCSLVFILGQD